MVLSSGGTWSSVFTYTTFSILVHLQYMVIIINASIIVVIIELPIVESSFTFMDDQKVGGDDLSLVKVLFMLNTNMCIISGILLARLFKFSSVVLDISKYDIKLQLLILE